MPHRGHTAGRTPSPFVNDCGCTRRRHRRGFLTHWARELLAAPAQVEVEDAASPPDLRPPCPCCGGRMVIIEIFQRAARARAPPSSPGPRCHDPAR